MDHHESAIRRFQWHVAGLLFIRNSFALVTAWAFLWGTGVLVMRVAFSTSPMLLLWGAAGIPLALAAAMILAIRKVPPPLTVRAVLDRQSRCGGLLMAAQEQPLDGWQATLPSVVAPRLRWHGGRTLGLFVAGTAFVLISFLTPQRLVAGISSQQALEIEEDVQRLAKKIEALKEEKLLDPVRATELEKKLNQVKDEALGEDPAKTWEALDHLEKMTSKAAKEGAEQALAETEKLSRAEKLAKALEQSAEAMKPEDLAAALGELAEMVDKAAKENQELLDKQLGEELMNAVKEGSFSPEQMKSLAEALKGSKKEIGEKLEKLKEAGLIDASTLKKFEKLAEEMDASSLAEFLKENAGEMSLEEMLSEKQDGKGGDHTEDQEAETELNWTDGTSEDGVKFKEQVLPPTTLQALKESALVGVSKGKPQTNPKAATTKSGALQGAKAGGGSANTQVILPRHKGAVERYFERK